MTEAVRVCAVEGCGVEYASRRFDFCPDHARLVKRLYKGKDPLAHIHEPQKRVEKLAEIVRAVLAHEGRPMPDETEEAE